MTEQATIDLFTKKAEAVSAVVAEPPTMVQAYNYIIDLCSKKDACQLLASGCAEPLSDAAEELCETKQTKVVVAPNLPQGEFNKLAKKCEKEGFECLREGMRERLAGVDIGVTICQAGIADTGTVVLRSNAEETRLATMISEIHVAILSKKALFEDTYAFEEHLAELLNTTPSYTAFITGPSRTADIERVLALGVHGPLELHVLLLDDTPNAHD